MRRAALCLTAAPCAVRAVAWLGRLAHPRAAILSGEAHSRVHERTAPTDAGSIGGNADTLVYREDGWRSRAPAARELRSHARLGAIKHDPAARQPAQTVSDRACVQEPTIGAPALCSSFVRSFERCGVPADGLLPMPAIRHVVMCRRTCNHPDRTHACAPRRQGTALPVQAESLRG
jgi:hypothetical protein